MRKSWLTAASVLAAAAVEGRPAEAQNISISPTSMDFGSVRIGTTGTTATPSGSKLTVTNNANLDSGSIGTPTAPFSATGTGPLTNLKNNNTNTASFMFAPTASTAGPDSQNVNVIGTKGTTTTTLPLALSGVGVPVYTSTPGPLSTINFDTVAPGAVVTEDLKISNTSPTGTSNAVSGLTLLTAALGPPGTGTGFSLPNFTPGTLLAAGNTFDLKIAFTAPTTPGVETETLAITTDQGPTLGTAGTVFDYTVTADVAAPAVPEPASLGLLATALTGLAAAIGWRRRKTGAAG